MLNEPTFEMECFPDIDPRNALVGARDGELGIAKRKLGVADDVFLPDAIGVLQAERDAATTALAELQQTTGSLCDKCGWSMVMDDGCAKCRADAAEARLATANGLLEEVTTELYAEPTYGRVSTTTMQAITAHLRGEQPAPAQPQPVAEPAKVRWYAWKIGDKPVSVRKGEKYCDVFPSGEVEECGQWGTIAESNIKEESGAEVDFDAALAHIGTDPKARLALWTASGEVLPVWVDWKCNYHPVALVEAGSTRAFKAQTTTYESTKYATMLIRESEVSLLTAQEAASLLAQDRVGGGA